MKLSTKTEDGDGGEPAYMPLVQLQESEYEVVVSVPPLGVEQGLVVQVTSPSAQNPVHRTFRAMLAIGIQIANTRVRLEGARTVQVLHLTEPDDRSPAEDRVFQVLSALLQMACSANAT